MHETDEQDISNLHKCKPSFNESADVSYEEELQQQRESNEDDKDVNREKD